MKKKPHGGARKGSGRPPGKVKEPTVVMRIPISLVEVVKKLIKTMKALIPFLLISLFFLGSCTETILEEVIKMDTVYIDKPRTVAPTLVTIRDTVTQVITDTVTVEVLIRDTVINNIVTVDTVIHVVTKDSIIYKEVEKLVYVYDTLTQVVNHYDTITEYVTDTVTINTVVYDRSIVSRDTVYLISGMIRPTTSIPEELIPLLLEYGEISEQYGKAAPGAEMIIQYMPQSEMPGELWHSFSFDFSNQWVIYLDVNVPLEQQKASIFRELMHLHHSKQYSNDPDKMMSPLFPPDRTITKQHLDELFR
jgi:hypothetical protein